MEMLDNGIRSIAKNITRIVKTTWENHSEFKAERDDPFQNVGELTIKADEKWRYL